MMLKLIGAALTAVLTVGLTGCAQKEPETTATRPPAASNIAPAAAVVTAHPLGSVKVGDKALCVICARKEGTSEAEEVKAVLDYQGKTYAFCNEAEKAEFISSPAKYAAAEK
jgi:YHS domain-containing protein